VGSASKKKKLRKSELTEQGQPGRNLSVAPAKEKAIRIMPEEVMVGVLFAALALLFTTQVRIQFTLPKLAVLEALTALLGLLWLYRLRKGEVKKIPPLILWAAFALAGWWIVSTLFAIHLPTALNGAYGRYNGLYTSVTYIILFLILSSLPFDKKQVERIVKVMTFMLVPVAVYALVQHYGLLTGTPIMKRPPSTIGNPVIVAAMLGLLLPFAVTFAVTEDGVGRKVFWGLLALLYLSAVFTTLSRGPLVGIVFSGLIIVAGYLAIKGVSLRRLLLLGSVVVVVGAILVSANYKTFVPMVKRFDLISVGKADPTTMVRLFCYQVALKSVKERPVTGAGFEHLRIVYPKYRPKEETRLASLARDVTPTMVHSGYLQMVFDTGVPSLLLYLVLTGAILYCLIKIFLRGGDEKTRFFSLAFFSSILGYMVQDTVGWPEISLAASFWMMLGFSVLWYRLSTVGGEEVVWSPTKKGIAYVGGSIVFLCLAFFSVKAVSLLYVDHLFFRGDGMVPTGNWARIEADIAEGLEFVPRDYNYLDQAGIFYTKKFAATGVLEDYNKGHALLKRANLANPYDVYAMFHGIDLDSLAMQKGKITHPSAFAEEAATRVIEMDRNNPSVYEVLMKFQFEQKRYKEFIDLLNRFRGLQAANFSYLLLEVEAYRAIGGISRGLADYRKTMTDLEKAGSLDKEWLQARQMTALLLIEEKRYKDALQEIQPALEKYPSSATNQAILGIIYGNMQRLDEAQKAFQIAVDIDPTNTYAESSLQKIKAFRQKR
jgi:O-antigen ligase/tetratricopeptide (TPR) repeat protein